MPYNWIKKCRKIAFILVVCLAVTDLGMAVSVCVNSDKGAEKTLIENYELDYYGADGDFLNPNDYSNSEVLEESSFMVNKDKKEYNILEIVPQIADGVMGYSISGLEPVYDGTDKVMREAYLDAIVNHNPGSSNANNQSAYMNEDIGLISSKMSENSGGSNAFEFESGKTYNGYYKYVGKNQGVFAIETDSSGHKLIDDKNVRMVSKFYKSGKNYVNDFGYIWKEDNEASDNSNPDDLSYIYVKNHKRIKYKSNDKFYTDCYGLQKSEVSDWKKNHKISLVTTTPMDVTMQQIEKADLIVLNAANDMDYYDKARNIYNRTHGTNAVKSGFSRTIDFPSFEVVIRIYERVVVRQDVSIVSSYNCLDGNNFNTNLRKLMCMLYYVQKPSNGSGPGSGREMFMDFMKRYVDEPGKYSTYDPEDGTTKTYYELRNNNLYSKFIAPSLRGKTSGYMHQTHPLVRTNDEAIYASHYDEGSGTVVADKGGSVKNRRTAKRDDTDMYYRDGDTLGLDINASYDEKKNYGEKVKEFYYSPTDSQFGVSDIIPWSASDRERKESIDYKSKYADYRWRMPLYESKSSTTDYVYIDDDGNFVRDTKYSGEWYGIDSLTGDGDVWEYKVVTWTELNESVWPWNVVSGDCLREWWFGEGSTQVPGNSRGKNIHLFYDYYQYGGYRVVNGQPPEGTYKNQSLVAQNKLLMNNSVKTAINGRDEDNRREDSPGDKHMTPTEDLEESVYYLLSVNILNGDGYNKSTSSTNKNKVMYINDYEQKASVTPAIPIKFRIRTSSDIKQIRLLKYDKNGDTSITIKDPNHPEDRTKDKTVKAKVVTTYTCSGSVASSDKLTFSGGNGFEMSKSTDDYDTDTHLPPTTGPSTENVYVYTFQGTIDKDLTYDWFKNSNNKFYVEVTIKPSEKGNSIKVYDDVTIAVRDFFDLN